MKFTQKLTGIIISLAFVLLFPLQTSACICSSTSPCTAYSISSKVFIGKLQKLESTSNSRPSVYAYFTPEKMFKGEMEKEIIVEFATYCREEPFKIGEIYFVYDDSRGGLNQCNMTHSFSKKSRDLAYAESVSVKNPKFLIKGRLGDLSDDELKQTSIVIEDGKKGHKITPKKYGFFEFSSKKQNSFKVKIEIPFRAEVFVNIETRSPIPVPAEDVKIIHSADQTSIEYDLKFKANECDVREIRFNKLTSKSFLFLQQIINKRDFLNITSSLVNSPLWDTLKTVS